MLVRALAIPRFPGLDEYENGDDDDLVKENDRQEFQGGSNDVKYLHQCMRTRHQ